jgi:hypothetical protein
MTTWQRLVAELAGCCAVLLAMSAAQAQTARAPPPGTPRWMFTLAGGKLEPELEGFEAAYGDADAGYVGAGFAYLFRPWLEAGAELGYMSEKGVGVIASQGVPGGEVEYSLLPVHFFLTFRGLFKSDQLFVPYIGFGATSAFYEQKIELQGDRSGWSDTGSMARLGVQLYLNRLDSDTAGGHGEGAIKQTYLYLEAQRISTKQSDIELGGDALVLGVRFTVGPNIDGAR